MELQGIFWADFHENVPFNADHTCISEFIHIVNEYLSVEGGHFVGVLPD
jgi:hypothetical protein